MTRASGWIYKPKKGEKERGVQIDVLIDRADNCINLGEIKYCDEEFVINKAYDQELREKRNVFVSKTKTKKNVILTLITPYGVKQNAGYFETAEVVLTMDSLF